jgi:putative flippase GtrA
MHLVTLNGHLQIPYLKMLTQFVKFAGVGALATSVQYLVLIALTESGLTGPVVASTLGYVTSGVLNYSLNYSYTFNSRERHRSAALKFVMVSSLGLGLNTSLMYVGVHILGFYYLLGQVLATGVVLLWNFFANRWWTFRAISQQS